VSLLEALLELLWPTRCAGCDLPGDVLCDACREALPRIERADACPLCGAPYGRFVCTECWDHEHAFEAALALGELAEPLSRAVALHKDGPEMRLAGVLGELVAVEIAAAWPGWGDGVAYVPATRKARSDRGFDHARNIAETVADRLGLPLLDVLERSHARDQRALGRQARARNVAGTFSAGACDVRHVLLVDDVLTTGATLDAATTALLEAGAAHVRVAVAARSW
jgi:ComF family protein